MQRRKLGLATLLLGGIMGGAAALQMGGGVRLAQAELVCTNPNDPMIARWTAAPTASVTGRTSVSTGRTSTAS